MVTLIKLKKVNQSCVFNLLCSTSTSVTIYVNVTTAEDVRDWFDFFQCYYFLLNLTNIFMHFSSNNHLHTHTHNVCVCVSAWSQEGIFWSDSTP